MVRQLFIIFLKTHNILLKLLKPIKTEIFNFPEAFDTANTIHLFLLADTFPGLASNY
jgi:hypothetical protein